MRRPPPPAAIVGIRLIVPTLALMGLFMLAVGHNEPGGGFAAGLLVGTGLIAVAVAAGPEIAEQMIPIRGEVILGFGLLIALAAGLSGLVWGEGFLDAVYVMIPLPGIEPFKLASVFVLDLGVMAVVIGLVAVIVDRFDAQELR